MSIVLVCGGRHYKNKTFLFRVMDIIHKQTPITKIVSGAARGADSLAVEWAIENNIEYVEYPADWEGHGKAAGHIRNQQMVDSENPDIVVAFTGGRGTQNMIATAMKHGVVTVIDMGGKEV